MAGAITVTSTSSRDGVGITKVTLDWTSDAGGDVSAILTTVTPGFIARVVTVPDGVAAPTALYDVTLLDLESVDLLEGLGANRAAAATEVIVPLIGASADVPVAIAEQVQLVVANAGNVKQGAVHLYIRH